MFYIGGEHSLESCGPRRGIEDTPQVVMVRYMRNDSIDELSEKKSSNNLMDMLKEDVDPVSQLVARYNGSAEPLQVHFTGLKLFSFNIFVYPGAIVRAPLILLWKITIYFLHMFEYGADY